MFSSLASPSTVILALDARTHIATTLVPRDWRKWPWVLASSARMTARGDSDGPYASLNSTPNPRSASQYPG